ncbi:hypothetical protein ACFLT9_03515 [Acidobacteriota bacterium]
MRNKTILSRSVLFCLIIIFISANSPLHSRDMTQDKDFAKFLDHVKKVYVNPNGKKISTMNPKQMAILFGYALGRQAPYVQDKPERKALYNRLNDLMLEALDHLAAYVYNSRLAESSDPGGSYEELKAEYKRLALAALGGYVDAEIERAISLPRVTPSIFEGKVFNLRNFRFGQIAGDYTMTPIDFQGNTYNLTLLTESGHVGSKIKGVGSGWSYGTTHIFIRNARNELMFEFEWYGDGVFRGHSVYKRQRNLDQTYELRRTDGFKFNADDPISPVDAMFRAEYIDPGDTARLNEAAVKADLIELQEAVQDFHSSYVAPRMIQKAKSAYDDQLSKIFTGSFSTLSVKQFLVKKLIPKAKVLIGKIKIDRESRTATINVGIGPNLILMAWDNTINMKLVDGEWRVTDFSPDPKLKAQLGF